MRYVARAAWQIEPRASRRFVKRIAKNGAEDANGGRARRAAETAHALRWSAAMKTIQPIALSVAMALAACGHEEPPKTPDQATNATPVQPIEQTQATPNPTPGSANPTGNVTSADVPHEGDTAGNPVAAENGATEAQPVMLNDAQILQITHTANAGEIEQARLALTKSQDARVRKFATMMIREHTQADSKGVTVARKDGITREPSPASELLESDAQNATRTLRAESGADFDKNYVDTQVREHQAVLDTIDQKLIPNAKSADVKAYLQDVRAAVATHLTHAEDLQKSMQK
jgi:putative membrane protein